MSEQKPNWVEQRAAERDKCQIDTIFEELLKAVDEAIAALRKCPGPLDFRYYKCEQAGNRTTVVRTDEEGLLVQGQPKVILEKFSRPPCIQVRRIPKPNLNTLQEGSSYAVTLNWNAEDQVCELIWDGDEDHPLGVQEVSKKALDPLFFGNDEA